MRTEGWRGKGGKLPTPEWRLQARKLNTIARTKSYGTGGLPRSRPVAKVTLPALRLPE